MTKTDAQLKQDIEHELIWDRKLNAAQIGVSVDQGAVSLMGEVDTYAAKWAAEVATKRVSGVRSIAQQLKVKLAADETHSDSEIASAALSALKWDVFVPGSVTARVQKGTLTLEGSVGWHYESEAAERAVRFIAGVLHVNNSIALKPTFASAENVKEHVQAALQRQATNDSNSIKVETSGGRVTLSGYASSWQSMEDASNAAWATPGVTDVIQHINILY